MHELRREYDLKDLLQSADMPRSTFYYYLKQEKTTDKYAQIKTQIRKIYERHKGRFGYRRIVYALRNLGFHINRRTVLRSMKVLGLKSVIRAKKYRSYRGQFGKAPDNILQHNFKAKCPSEKWATDVTEFKVGSQKVYLSPVIDLFNGEIISYELAGSPNFKQVTDMLKKAFKRVPGKRTNLIIHSDQGWQYQMKAYQDLLRKKAVVQSMSRKGNCLDNAVIENFFGTIKSELFYLKKYQSIEELKKDIKSYITYYNHDRIRINLEGTSPVKYRTHRFKN
ncbi:IS3 family transposase [Pedobacter endophyticus]|uniref:IS3 family transposase n=1 Tax=Pedobacter endophyticus TaxID=2789740 RepID=UPI001E445A76|nr:IS3 family transposase [Pedobacter endophyticus]